MITGKDSATKLQAGRMQFYQLVDFKEIEVLMYYNVQLLA